MKNTNAEIWQKIKEIYAKMQVRKFHLATLDERASGYEEPMTFERYFKS